MGLGYTMRCPKCHYVFTNNLGIGFMYPIVKREVTEKAKIGKMGKTLKRFFDENPAGSLDISKVTLCCEKCGNLFGDMDLTMYVQRDGQEMIKYKDFPHRCGKCRGRARIMEEDDVLMCPKCKIPLEKINSIMWD